jgi:WD40 repeat protein
VGLFPYVTRPDTRVRRLTVYEVATGQPAGPEVELDGELQDAAVCGSTRTVAAVSRSGRAGKLHVWDLLTGQPTIPTRVLPSSPRNVAFPTDGARVAVLCAGGEIVVLDRATGREVCTYREEGAREARFHTDLLFTPDGTTLVALGTGSRVHVLDSTTGKPLYPPLSPAPPGGSTLEIALSPDGRLLATAGANAAGARVQVWDLASGKRLAEPLPHPSTVVQLGFNGDGTRVFTACMDGQARLWEWQTGRLLGPACKHEDAVEGAALTPDGRWGVTACRDSSVRVWEFTTGKPVMPPLNLGRPTAALPSSASTARACSSWT